MRKLIACLAILLALPAAAQTPQPPTPAERAMNARVLVEINANLQANARIFQLEDELAKAQARIKELEPPKDPPAK